MSCFAPARTAANLSSYAKSCRDTSRFSTRPRTVDFQEQETPSHGSRDPTRPYERRMVELASGYWGMPISWRMA